MPAQGIRLYAVAITAAQDAPDGKLETFAHVIAAERAWDALQVAQEWVLARYAADPTVWRYSYAVRPVIIEASWDEIE